jgi:prepilin-type N-terminal cleavage/methylation domain-containing protein
MMTLGMLPTSNRRGFSFVELLFAIIILGVGFIMIAAIFPVAIQQTKATREESGAASMGRTGLSLAEQVFQNSDSPAPPTNTFPMLPPTGSAASVTGVVSQLPAGPMPGTAYATWQLWRNNAILPQDPRFGFVLLYRRDGNPADPTKLSWSSSAQLYLIQAQARNTPTFRNDAAQDDVGAAPIANLQARPIAVQVVDNYQGSGTDIISFSASNNAAYAAPIRDAALGAVVTGAVVIIADDKIDSTDATSKPDVGRMNGHIYRVGLQRTDISATAWELMPGFDFTPDPGADGVLNGGGSTADDDIYGIGNGTTLIAPSKVKTTGPAEAWILGRGFMDPTTTPLTADGYGGPGMDIGVFTTWVSVK